MDSTSDVACDSQILDSGAFGAAERSGIAGAFLGVVDVQRMSIAVENTAVGLVFFESDGIGDRQVGHHDGIDIGVSFGIFYPVTECCPVTIVAQDEI